MLSRLDSLRREYTDPKSAAGLPFRVGGEIAGAVAPVVLYLAVQQYSGYSVEGAMRLQYAKHTPQCKKLPEGIHYFCGVPFYGRLSACDLFADIQSGYALQPSYVPRNVTGTPALEYVWSDPFLANENTTSSWHSTWPTSRTGAWPLSYNDTKRFDAVQKYEKEGGPVGDAVRYQGYAVIYGMFSSQVFARVARVTFVDAVRFSVSWAEGVALASTFLLVLLAFFTLGSSAGVYTQYNTLLRYTSGFLVLFLLFSLWRIAVHAKTTVEMKEMKKKEEEEREKRDRTSEDQADEGFTATAYLRPRRESTLPSSASSPSAAAAATVSNTTTGVQQDALDAAVAALQRELKLARKEAAESKRKAASVELRNVELERKVAGVKKESKRLEEKSRQLERQVEGAKKTFQKEVAALKVESEKKMERVISNVRASHAKDMAAMLSRLEALEAATGGGKLVVRRR